MNEVLMEQLLHEGESSSLDYKRDQYPFAAATDDEKSELLKDILTFANGWRHAEAYILIGVEEVVGGRSTVVGVGHHIPENNLQQFVNSKTHRRVTFSYRAYPFEGKQVGVITIPQQDRPIYLTKNYGKLQKHLVYYRQGTTTAIATPDDIARMGTPVEIRELLGENLKEAKKDQVIWENFKKISIGLTEVYQSVGRLVAELEYSNAKGKHQLLVEACNSHNKFRSFLVSVRLETPKAVYTEVESLLRASRKIITDFREGMSRERSGYEQPGSPIDYWTKAIHDFESLSGPFNKILSDMHSRLGIRE